MTEAGDFPEAGVEGIRVVDDKTIVVELVSSYSYFLKILSQSCCTIYPKEAYDMYGGDLRAHTVGTGPFMIKNKDINEDVELRMVKNPNYWEKDENNNADEEKTYLSIHPLTGSCKNWNKNIEHTVKCFA